MSHRNISWVKSVMRIAGYFLLIMNLDLAVLMLVMSEVVGIIEEVGEE